MDKEKERKQLKEENIKLKEKISNLEWGEKRTNDSIKALYREISKKNKELEYLNEMKSDFVSTVSHELRTPLTSIKESINLISEEIPGKVNKDQKRFLQICENNIDRLSRLIGQVLDSQKIRTGKMEFNFEKNNVNEVVEEIYKSMVVVTDEKGLSLDLELDKDLPDIKFDKDRILQVLTNLVNNAIKFTDRGGITIITKGKKNIVKVSVKDTGRGIKEKDINSLFQDFKQLGGVNERKVGGTGLELSISKKIVNTHGGKIWVESKFGEGATFSFVLPIKERRKR